MVEMASTKFVCIVDDTKLVKGLGGSGGVPLLKFLTCSMRFVYLLFDAIRLMFDPYHPTICRSTVQPFAVPFDQCLVCDPRQFPLGKYSVQPYLPHLLSLLSL